MSFGEKSNAPWQVVSVNDPAVDRGVEGTTKLLQYIEERGDPATSLVFLPGSRPAVWTLRPLPYESVLTLEGVPNEHSRHAQAFQVAFVSVEDLGLDWSPGTKQTAAWDEADRVLSREALNALASKVGTKIVEELGAVALQKARMTVGQKKAFWLARGCEVAWANASPATSPTSPTRSE